MFFDFSFYLREDKWLRAALDCLDFLPDQPVVEVSRELPHCFPQCEECCDPVPAGGGTHDAGTAGMCVGVDPQSLFEVQYQSWLNSYIPFLYSQLQSGWFPCPLQALAVTSRLVTPKAVWLSVSCCCMGLWSNITVAPTDLHCCPRTCRTSTQPSLICWVRSSLSFFAICSATHFPVVNDPDGVSSLVLQLQPCYSSLLFECPLHFSPLLLYISVSHPQSVRSWALHSRLCSCVWSCCHTAAERNYTGCWHSCLWQLIHRGWNWTRRWRTHH